MRVLVDEEMESLVAHPGMSSETVADAVDEISQRLQPEEVSTAVYVTEDWL